MSRLRLLACLPTSYKAGKTGPPTHPRWSGEVSNEADDRGARRAPGAFARAITEPANPASASIAPTAACAGARSVTAERTSASSRCCTSTTGGGRPESSRRARRSSRRRWVARRPPRRSPQRRSHARTRRGSSRLAVAIIPARILPRWVLVRPFCNGVFIVWMAAERRAMTARPEMVDSTVVCPSSGGAEGRAGRGRRAKPLLGSKGEPAKCPERGKDKGQRRPYARSRAAGPWNQPST